MKNSRFNNKFYETNGEKQKNGERIKRRVENLVPSTYASMTSTRT